MVNQKTDGARVAMRLTDYIRIEQGFQNSVNIAYDLFSDDKLKRFIPTRSSIEVIEDAMLCTADKSTDRARILIGAYGKGKSHIVLVLLSLLYRKEENAFDELLSKIKTQNANLYHFAVEYIKSEKRLLPIIISGSNTSLTQSFLGAIQKALIDADLEKLMPETHFQAALNMIGKWENEYKETYTKFTDMLDEPIKEFSESLASYDVDSYEKFIEIYPTLTSGGIFNPFIGFDVVELYEKINGKLCDIGYNGIYIIYDEFSKYLEASINKASISDIKMLQDFAEKCNRSGSKQMHLMLIAHKDISNYIDKLPKNKVDGWRGVSERFKHVELHNNFSQIYEIIGAVIKRDPDYFSVFFDKYADKFNDLKKGFGQSALYEELTPEQLETVFLNTYPLHPLSTFILPRLSEKVAQNERTLFTFLSAENRNTLSSFLNSESGDFPMLTPDIIYDYFEPLFKKEPYTSETHQVFVVAKAILSCLDPFTLSAKIIKTIALIYIVGQFEKLPPIADIIIKAYKESIMSDTEIISAIEELQNKQYVIYIKKSNGFLKLKKRYDGNIQDDINKTVEKNRNTYSIKQILENASAENYLYPTRYNDEYEITRYFDFSFMTSLDFLSVDNWNKRIDNINADGIVYGIIPSSEDDISKIEQHIYSLADLPEQLLFIVPNSYTDIFNLAFEYQAIKEIKESANENEALIEECNIYIEDLEEVIAKYIYSFTKPETRNAKYYQKGVNFQIFRKAQLSQRLSEICESIYINTPIINNESINKDYLTTVAINSRNKIVTALLSNKLDSNLGLSGNGQEISMMRSTLINTKIITNIDSSPQIDFSAGGNRALENVLVIISNFIQSSNNNSKRSFQDLYNILTLPKHTIGLKKGVIPIYIAVVLHKYKEYCVIENESSEVLITADLLDSINEKPSGFTICLEDWNEEKNRYIKGLEKLFSRYIVNVEKEYNTFSYIVKAMNRWFIAQPKYAKQIKKTYQDSKFTNLSKQDQKMINSLKSSEINAREYLFEIIMNIYDKSDFSASVLEDISETKALVDNCKTRLIEALATEIGYIFNPLRSKDVSLSSSIKEWYEGLNNSTLSHIFDNTNPYVLELMKAITSDESGFLEKLAKTVTGLRIDDWEDKNIVKFLDEIKEFKQVVEAYDKNQSDKNTNTNSNMYMVSTVSQDGVASVKTFNKIEYSKRAKLLKNELQTAIDEMGQSITEAEKRQILIELIEKMC